MPRNSGFGLHSDFAIRVSEFALDLPLHSQHLTTARHPMTSLSYANDLRSEYARLITRRWFFRQCGVGLGSIALASLLQDDKALSATSPTGSNPLAPKSPHFKPK